VFTSGTDEHLELCKARMRTKLHTYHSVLLSMSRCLQVFTSGTDEHLELCKAVKELVTDDLRMECPGQPPQASHWRCGVLVCSLGTWLCKAVKELVTGDLKIECPGQPPQVCEKVFQCARWSWKFSKARKCPTRVT